MGIADKVFKVKVMTGLNYIMVNACVSRCSIEAHLLHYVHCRGSVVQLI